MCLIDKIFIYEDNKSRVMDKDNVVVCIFPLQFLGHLTETKTKITYLQIITTKTKTIYKYYFPPKLKLNYFPIFSP